jgi:uncharacterized protein YqeY
MYTKIKNEIKEAMKNKNTTKRDVLKMVVDKAKSLKKEKYPNDTTDTISNEFIVSAINKEIKQLNQTKDALNGREDTDLYKETEIKITILSDYLPKMMTREEVEIEVKRILSNGEYNNFGLQMKAVMSELKGKADNKVIKEIVDMYKK